MIIVRLDKYLKVCRIFKRRTVSKDIISFGQVSINNKKTKPSSEVKIGDHIKLNLSNKEITIEVLSKDDKIKKNEVTNLYKIIDEIIEEDKDEDKKVAKRCRKILKEKEKEEYNRNLMSDQGRERIMNEYKKKKKKELIKIAKKKGFYSKGMDKDDILSFLRLCL